MRFLLDTDHLSILQWESGPECQRVLSRIAICEPGDVAVSIVSFHEQALGFNTMLSRARSKERVVEAYELFRDLLNRYSRARVVDFDLSAAAVVENLKSRKVRVKMMDLRIAATALSNDLTLISRNAVDFERVPGLRIEDWTK